MDTEKAEMAAAAAAAPLSFSFAKKRPISSKTLSTTSALTGAEAGATGGAAKVPEEPDYVHEVNVQEGVKGSKVAPEEQGPLVIPCPGNDIAFQKSQARKESKAKAKERASSADKVVEVKAEAEPEAETEAPSLTDLAAQELLQDASNWLKRRAEGDDEPTEAMVIGGPGEGAVAEEASSLPAAAEASSLADYDNIPVEGFGMGMLRGMGFKAGQGIGGFKQADVKCIEPVNRPKGLGLGASRGRQEAAASTAKASETADAALVMKRGAHVLIESGSQKGAYAQVEGMDDESARVFIKLAVGGDTRSVSENAVKLVTKQEYAKYSKVINRDMYDKYAERQKSREETWHSDRNRRSRSRSPHDGDKPKKSRKEDEYKNGKSSTSTSSTSKSSQKSRPSWVRPLLRVRFIDEKYKKGRYYNTKMIVEDVVSRTCCVCRTAAPDRRVLDDVHPDQLETLIPKSEGDVVMIVRYDDDKRLVGQLAELLRRDKRKCVAAVQLLPDKDQVLKLDYDEICEYAGEVME